MTEKFSASVVDVATKREYVPPQIEVVELERQILLQVTSPGKAGWGNGIGDGGEYPG